MLRILIAILFFFSGASLIIEHCKAYSHGIVLFSENEDNGGFGSEPEKAKEENLGEKLFYSQSTSSSASFKISGLKPTYEQPSLTPGFTDRPYLPPDLT